MSGRLLGRYNPGLEVASERDLYGKGMFVSCAWGDHRHYVNGAINRNSRSELKWDVDAIAAHGGYGALEFGRCSTAHHKRADGPVNDRIVGAVGVALTQSGLIEAGVDDEQSTRFTFLTLQSFLRAL